MLKKMTSALIAYICVFAELFGQSAPPNASAIKIQLEKLNVLGSVLYFAAHPDDENTRLIAWLSQEKKYRTGYLSLTRGEGGQNLIGTDLGIDLGLTRTHELLAARSIDKGEQLFSSAYDFGFSKTHQETFNFWEKDRILSESVYIIRKFQPDIIITRFPPDKRGGHGHHQASAILAHEAFIAAADPTRYPEQLAYVKPWKATRLIWNTANFGGMNNTSDEQLKIDIGAYNTLLGQSYGEIASLSRSQHKSQGFGAASTRGRSIEYFEHVAGKEAKSDLMDDLNTSWGRIAGTEKIQDLVQKVNQYFDPSHPERIIPDLFDLRKEIDKISDLYWKKQKIDAIENLILSCAGIWIEATAPQPQVAIDQQIPVTIEAIVRNPGVTVQIVSIDQQKQHIALSENIIWKGQATYIYQQTTQPYWLHQPPAQGSYAIDIEDYGFATNKEKPHIQLVLQLGNEKLSIHRPIKYSFVDPVMGEIYQDLSVSPKLTVESKKEGILFTNKEERMVEVVFTNHDPKAKKYTIKTITSGSWSVKQEVIDLDFSTGNSITKQLWVKPTKQHPDKGEIAFSLDGNLLSSIKTINYSHIPRLTWFPQTAVKLQYTDLVNPIQKIGYIQGAGDLIPESLNNIGIAVSILTEQQIRLDYLKQFDAIVIGVRYFNVDEKSTIALPELLKYADQGGVVLAQYNVNSKLQTTTLGPHPFQLSRDRVTEENAVVDFDPHDPALNYPNKITTKDFDGWVQERGLYFADNIDKAYRTPLSMHDTGESPHSGSLLIAPYGKGKFVYTSLSFFRQLPAGVPGAYRLFVNLLSTEK